MAKRLFNKGNLAILILTLLVFSRPVEALAAHRYSSKSHQKSHFRGTHFTSPYGSVSLSIGGFRFYYGDTFYRKIRPCRYVFIPAPVVSVPERVIVAQAPTVQTLSGEDIVVNIPNSNGSYTSITLHRSGDGYMGPQGEYYPDNPTVDQLRALYGK